MQTIVIQLYSQRGMVLFVSTTKVTINILYSFNPGGIDSDMWKGVKTWEVTTWENLNFINF